jgi:hypothetical protein
MVSGEADLGFHPELGFSVRAIHVNVHPLFFPGKEEESISLVSKYRRTHPK